MKWIEISLNEFSILEAANKLVDYLNLQHALIFYRSTTSTCWGAAKCTLWESLTTTVASCITLATPSPEEHIWIRSCLSTLCGRGISVVHSGSYELRHFRFSSLYLGFQKGKNCPRSAKEFGSAKEMWSKRRNCIAAPLVEKPCRLFLGTSLEHC